MTTQSCAADNKIDVWVVLLCGLPGSGKSTLRRRLVHNGWAYVSQDEMGSLDVCEKALIKALKAGKSIAIDRCNVTPSERRLCLQLANRAVDKGVAKGVTLHFEAVWMAVAPDVCKHRAATREEHETLSSEHADGVIDEFCKGLMAPERSGQEPYEAVHVISDQSDADLIVQRFADPTHVDANVKPTRCMGSGSLHNTDDDGSQLESDMSLPAELFVVRHGERADRARGCDEGYPDDTALTKEGRQTAKRAGIFLRKLEASRMVAVYSSPFFRCLQTANEIAAELGLPVRVEPGLSELCASKIFDHAPHLRTPAEAVSRALIRVEVDASQPPIQPAPPDWPEQPRAANSRVVRTAQLLADRHPGQAICLVCHSHSVVEITRHVSKEGGGAASSTAPYCALSHISPTGILRRCLDVSYLKDISSQDGVHVDHSCSPDPAVGFWEDGWRWNDAVASDPVDELLQLSLDEVLMKYPRFHQLFERGDENQKSAWRRGWLSADDCMHAKLNAAFERGIFAET